MAPSPWMRTYRCLPLHQPNFVFIYNFIIFTLKIYSWKKNFLTSRMTRTGMMGQKKYIKGMGTECWQGHLSRAPSLVGTEHTRKFCALQAPKIAKKGISRVFYSNTHQMGWYEIQESWWIMNSLSFILWALGNMGDTLFHQGGWVLKLWLFYCQWTNNERK